MDEGNDADGFDNQMDRDNREGSARPDEHVDSDNDTPNNDLAMSSLEDLQKSLYFISLITRASLGDAYCGMEEDDIESLRDPIADPSCADEEVNPDFHLSLDVYLACINASQDTYTRTLDAIRCQYPESQMLSYYQVLCWIWDLSGVVPIAHDMCVKSCIAYTGVFSQLVSCKFCNEPHYMTHVGKPITPDKFIEDE